MSTGGDLHSQTTWEQYSYFIRWKAAAFDACIDQGFWKIFMFSREFSGSQGTAV
jgi:hypothetical protein